MQHFASFRSARSGLESTEDFPNVLCNVDWPRRVKHFHSLVQTRVRRYRRSEHSLWITIGQQKAYRHCRSDGFRFKLFGRLWHRSYHSPEQTESSIPRLELAWNDSCRTCWPWKSTDSASAGKSTQSNPSINFHHTWSASRSAWNRVVLVCWSST